MAPTLHRSTLSLKDAFTRGLIRARSYIKGCWEEQVKVVVVEEEEEEEEGGGRRGRRRRRWWWWKKGLKR